ncbi:MAG: tyrosine-type recombinase/integrase [Bacteroidetes bacterium]|nr:tyrosine-type recombinase/integrase [Bacteroidota bacterium]
MNHISNFIGYITTEKRYSIHTVQAYQSDLEQFFLFVKSQYELEQPIDIKHTHIRSWLATLKNENLGSGSINRKISSLKSFFKYLQKQQVITISPTGKIISPKKPKRLPSFVNEKNMQNLLHEITFTEGFAGKTERLIIDILYQCGLRRAELCGLHLVDIDFYNNSLKVLGKGNKERIIPIGKDLSNSIHDYINERSLIDGIAHSQLLINAKGKPVGPKFVYNVVHKYLGESTTLEKRSPHVLRHTFATHLLNKGADLNAVKELLGHANLSATQIYTHNTIDTLKEIYKKAHPKA